MEFQLWILGNKNKNNDDKNNNDNDINNNNDYNILGSSQKEIKLYQDLKEFHEKYYLNTQI